MQNIIAWVQLAPNPFILVIAKQRYTQHMGERLNNNTRVSARPINGIIRYDECLPNDDEYNITV